MFINMRKFFRKIVNDFKRINIKGCKYHEYETITNLYGDCINLYSNAKMTVRSIRRCKHCGKIKYSPYIDLNCDTVNFKLKMKRLEGGKN